MSLGQMQFSDINEKEHSELEIEFMTKQSEKNQELEKLRTRVEELESHLKKQVESEEVFIYPNDWILAKRLLEKDWK